MWKYSFEQQHFFVYFALLVFWALVHVFSRNAFGLGWGFFPFVITLPFIPFILVWLGVQFSRHLKHYQEGICRSLHVFHCFCTATLFSLFVFHFVY
ncbi:hypothetical protein EKG39_11365 [Shewanella atlantica]|uniref:Uncharacterized protein n=1 Tax=Shewanella atlantica TaxID=271099 RepID=A0A3S0IVB0_9GAMM|nr:hypothetical protein EKG39_11365 [Shewanella atlantica]